MKNIESNIIMSVDRQPQEIMGGIMLDLSLLEYWDELNDEQQRYLTEYSKGPESRMTSAMNIGIKMSKVNRWFKEEYFSEVSSQIYEFYTENLKMIDFDDAIHDPKHRARVIKARENKGAYTEKKEKATNNHLHLHGMDSLRGLLGGD